MNEFIKVQSTSRHSAVCSEIELRLTKTTRLIFRPELVDNPKNSAACVRGIFIFQRKNTKGNWDDYKDFDLSRLKDAEGVKLELKSEEILKFITELNNHYKIFEKYGIPYGQKEFLVTPKNVKQIILQFLQNPENFKKLQELQIEDLKKLTLISSINSLKTIHQSWIDNKNNSEEKFWQNFFKDNSWVISQIFSFPVVLFKDKAYVGGKTLDNKGGEIIDFIYKHHFTDNVLLVEIKTPTLKLLGSEYRDGIFSINQDLTGAVNQLLNYKNELAISYSDLIRKSGKTFAVFNPRCMIIAGNIIEELNSDDKKKTFELSRNDSRQIDIIGFDELFQKVKYLVDILEK